MPTLDDHPDLTAPATAPAPDRPHAAIVLNKLRDYWRRRDALEAEGERLGRDLQRAFPDAGEWVVIDGPAYHPTAIRIVSDERGARAFPFAVLSPSALADVQALADANLDADPLF